MLVLTVFVMIRSDKLRIYREPNYLTLNVADEPFSSGIQKH